MEKSVIFFTKGDSTRFPIIKAFNIPDFVTLPKNITTIKSSNISLKISVIKNGHYKLIGEFIEDDNKEVYLKIDMVMEVYDIDSAIKQHEESL